MSFCVHLRDLRGGDARAPHLVGGKAGSLVRLAAAGFPVPAAFAVTSDLFRALRAGQAPLPAALDGPDALAAAAAAGAALATTAWPPGFEDELAAALATLTAAAPPGPKGGEARFSVRSSAAIEDRADALGAGIFLSRTGVAASDVAAAVREVLGAALAPAALAYAARRGLATDELAMAVLVHAFTPGDAFGTVACDAAAQLEIDGASILEIAPGASHELSPGARARIAGAARALAERGEAVELEWVATGDDVLFLQLRPWRAPVRRAWSHAGALAAPAGSPPWAWDAAHNPLPLSPAQAGLVALVDEGCQTAYRQRVVGGYLFYAPVLRSEPLPAEAGRGRWPKAAGEGTAPLQRRPPHPDPLPATRGEGDQMAGTAPAAFAALVAAVEPRLAALGPEPPLEEALELFVDAYAPLFGVVQPAARAAREALATYLGAHARAESLASLLRGVPSAATERARRADAIAASADPAERRDAVAAYLALFGDESPVWDVAVPTYAEEPSALARVAASGPTPAAHEALALPADGAALLAAARAAAAIAEDDDLLYARLQARVRAALLREGRRLQAANLLARPEDVFWLPLEAVRRDARGEAPLTLAAVTHAIAEARAAHAAALADPPPLAGARPGWDARAGGVRGRPASGGRAIGPAHLHDPSRPTALPAGAILIARTLLPTELPLLAPAAIVVETGGALGHVAAQARERGLPAIVDAAGAATAFREGDRVLVDGDAGVAIVV